MVGLFIRLSPFHLIYYKYHDILLFKGCRIKIANNMVRLPRPLENRHEKRRVPLEFDDGSPHCKMMRILEQCGVDAAQLTPRKRQPINHALSVLHKGAPTAGAAYLVR